MSNNWQEFENNTVLFAGDEIKMSQHCKNAGATGTVVRHKRKNYAVIIDGKDWRGSKEWSIPPSLIVEYRRGTGQLPVEVKAKSKIKTSSERFYAECQGGDICLMHRGGSLFDVVEVIDFDKSRAKAVLCRVVGKNKTYRYDAAWYVQKLDGLRITTE